MPNEDYRSTPVDKGFPKDISEGASLEESDLVRKCYRELSAAREYRKQFDKDWHRFYLLYAGQHWDGRQADWQSTPVINLTKSFVQTVIPILTDNRPQISVISPKAEFENSADIMGMILEWLWDANDCHVMLPKVMTNAMIFGNGFKKVRWNPSLANGEGDIEIVPVDPVNIFVSPFARSIDEAEYVIHAENLPRSLVERMYGELFSQKQGPKDPKLTVVRNVTNQYTNEHSEGGPLLIRATDGSSVGAYQGGAAPVPHDQGDELVTVLEKFENLPNQQVRQIVIVNDELKVDQIYPVNKIPFVQFVDMPHTWAFWAEGEVQQVEKLQLEINRRRGHLMDILRLTANPMLAVDPSLVEDYNSIVPRPGLVIPVEGGPAGIGWIPVPAIPNALFEINAIDKADFDTVLGNVDVIQGRRPEGIEAGVAIELLQEAANVRMRLKVRHMENSIRLLGKLLCKFVQVFYTTERIFRISGAAAQRSEVPLSQDHYLKINEAVKGTLDAEGNPQVQYQNAIPGPLDVEFDVRVGSGTTLPVSKTTQFQKCITLFQLGVIDDEELLRNSGLPHWQDVYSRVQMKRMQAVQAAQAQEQAIPQEPSEAEVDEELAGGELPPPDEEVF